MLQVDHRRTAIWLSLAFAATLAVFSIWPELDLLVSSAFYDPVSGFGLSANPPIQMLREFVWDLSIGVVLVSVVALTFAAFNRPLPWVDIRAAGFVFLLYLLGPILLVNGILKRFWGRARPADIVEFGGSREFTPPWLPADQCASNCSFVSGEGSAATALAIVFFLFAPMVRKSVPRGVYLAYLFGAVVLPLSGLVLRVATGRHFLSDTIFAVLLVAGLALILHRLLLSGRRD